jgi:NAD-dependent SIR2 family protein deacetylase
MTGLNVAYLIIGTILSFFGVLFAAHQLIAALQKKWLADQKNLEAITHNTDAIVALTGRIDSLEQTVYHSRGNSSTPERSP